MDNDSGDGLAKSTKKAGRAKWVAAGVLSLAVLAVVCLFLYSKSKPPAIQPSKVEDRIQGAELIRSVGTVLRSRPGRSGWQPVGAGARLMEGDLVQTDRAGEACIRYASGMTVTVQESTIYAVHEGGDGTMEMSVSAPSPSPDPAAGAVPGRNAPAGSSSDPIAQSGENAQGAPLFIKLDSIVPFGRSLELIGKVEPGSKLSVNSESAEVDADGLFKHFTNPFPGHAPKVDLVLKVTDLAGRTRTITAAYDFSKRSRAR
jgi:hypothetical protein